MFFSLPSITWVVRQPAGWHGWCRRNYLLSLCGLFETARANTYQYIFTTIFLSPNTDYALTRFWSQWSSRNRSLLFVWIRGETKNNIRLTGELRPAHMQLWREFYIDMNTNILDFFGNNLNYSFNLHHPNQTLHLNYPKQGKVLPQTTFVISQVIFRFQGWFLHI